MKTILAVTAATLSVSSFANTQNQGMGRFDEYVDIQSQEAKATEGNRHMIEFNAESIPSLVYAIEKTKTEGTSSENDSDTTLIMNYAYSFHPNFQLGGRINYFNGVFANNDVERFDVSAKGWFNLKAGDLANSAFLAASIGTGWAQTFGTNGGRDDLWLASVSIGKRFSMDPIGLNNVSWTPEIALVNENSTNNSSFNYRQATEFRIVQFSVIW